MGLIEGIPNTAAKNDDDFLDRLSSRYTVVIIVVSAVVITAQQYVGNAITCWVPVHFTGQSAGLEAPFFQSSRTEQRSDWWFQPHDETLIRQTTDLYQVRTLEKKFITCAPTTPV